MLNIVAKRDGWVLEKFADTLADFVPGAQRSERPDKHSMNLYVPYYTYEGPTLCDIALFTHRELSDHPKAVEKRMKFDDVAKRVDHCVAMSNRTAEWLPEDKTTVVEIPVDSSFCKPPLILGVCAQEQPFDRKGLGLAEQLGKLPGVVTVVTNGALAHDALLKWYEAIDYLVVLSDNEGGPLPVKEAIAMGKPVIAPDVGWAWDYPVLRYETKEQLFEMVRKLSMPLDNWQVCARAIMEIAAKEMENGRRSIQSRSTRGQQQVAGR